MYNNNYNDPDTFWFHRLPANKFSTSKNKMMQLTNFFLLSLLFCLLFHDDYFWLSPALLLIIRFEFSLFLYHRFWTGSNLRKSSGETSSITLRIWGVQELLIVSSGSWARRFTWGASRFLSEVFPASAAGPPPWLHPPCGWTIQLFMHSYI